MSPSKKPQTPIRLDPAIRARLVAYIARNKWMSINATVNEALDRFLPPLDGNATPPPVTPPNTPDDAALDWE